MSLCKKSFHKHPFILSYELIAVILAVAIILSLSLSFADDSNILKGKVFIDLNKNGKQEDSEPGVENVLITDGKMLIRTDEKGSFEFQSKNASSIWLSLPPDLKAKKSHFYPVNTQCSSYDFPIVKANLNAKDQEKTLIFMADLHLRDEPFIKENLKKVADRINLLKPEAIFMLGDLVNRANEDDQATAEKKFALLNTFRKSLSAPSYCVVGNNDTVGWWRSDQNEGNNPLYGKKMFEKYIGPRYYSINAAGFHIIASDDIQGKQSPLRKEILGWIEKSQLEWLQEDLKNVPPDTQLIILSHIPYLTSRYRFSILVNPNFIDYIMYYEGRFASPFHVANFDQLSELLKPFKKITFVAGHLHIFEQGRFKGLDRIINYFVCGSISAAAWRSNLPSLRPLTTTFAPGIMVATCKNGEFIQVQYETFDFFNDD